MCRRASAAIHGRDWEFNKGVTTACALAAGTSAGVTASAAGRLTLSSLLVSTQADCSCAQGASPSRCGRQQQVLPRDIGGRWHRVPRPCCTRRGLPRAAGSICSCKTLATMRQRQACRWRRKRKGCWAAGIRTNRIEWRSGGCHSSTVAALRCAGAARPPLPLAAADSSSHCY